MNKMVKGSVAGAAGIALLMGGFGTYALWQDQITAHGGVITAGALTINDATSGDGVWHYGSATGAQITNPDFRMVPGDKVVLVQPLDVTAVGDHLSADLIISNVDNKFSNDFTMTVDYAKATPMVFTGKNSAGEAAGTYKIGYGPAEMANLTATNVATITFELAGKSTVDNTDQNASINLNNVTVTLKQKF